MNEDLIKRLQAIRTASNPEEFRQWTEDWARDSTEAAEEIIRLENENADLRNTLRDILVTIAKHIGTATKVTSKDPGISDWRQSGTCRSGQDGECWWEDCPQERDGEPKATGRTCPLYRDPEEY